jgi:hypothetical protein
MYLMRIWAARRVLADLSWGRALKQALGSRVVAQDLATADITVRTAIFRSLGVSRDVQTLDQLNCAKRQLSLPAEFGGLSYRASSSTLNIIIMPHSLRPSPP